MKQEERIILIGKLYQKYNSDINCDPNTLRARVVHRMLQKLVKGGNPILEGTFSVTAMPEPYDNNRHEIWKYLQELARENETTPLKYAAEYAHNNNHN